MSKPLPFALLFSVVIAMTCAPTHAKVYKWVDENGVVQYTQYPPPKGDSEELETTAGPSASPEQQSQELQERLDNLNKAESEREQAEAEAADQQARQEKLKARCDRIRANLDILSKNTRVVEESEDGSRAYLTDEQREQRIASGNQQLSEFCQDI